MKLIVFAVILKKALALHMEGEMDSGCRDAKESIGEDHIIYGDSWGVHMLRGPPVPEPHAEKSYFENIDEIFDAVIVAFQSKGRRKWDDFTARAYRSNDTLKKQALKWKHRVQFGDHVQSEKLRWLDQQAASDNDYQHRQKSGNGKAFTDATEGGEASESHRPSAKAHKGSLMDRVGFDVNENGYYVPRATLSGRVWTAKQRSELWQMCLDHIEKIEKMEERFSKKAQRAEHDFLDPRRVLGTFDEECIESDGASFEDGGDGGNELKRWPFAYAWSLALADDADLPSSED
jgi:hypothetical protein